MFFVAFKNLFANPLVIEKARLQLALIIPTGAPITVANDAIEMLAVATDKTINDVSNYSLALFLVFQNWLKDEAA